jgi:hypothetical protein
MADLSMTQWRSWKSQLVPLLYDWFINHELEWPSQACRYHTSDGWLDFVERMPLGIDCF